MTTRFLRIVVAVAALLVGIIEASMARLRSSKATVLRSQRR